MNISTGKRISHTWRKNCKLRWSGARPPNWVVERKAYPLVGLTGEFLWSILNVYFKDDNKLCPSCLRIDLDDICDGSVMVRHPRLYAKSWCFVENKPREIPANRSLYEENSFQSWDCINTRATIGVTNPLSRGTNTPTLSSDVWLGPYATEPSHRSPYPNKFLNFRAPSRVQELTYNIHHRITIDKDIRFSCHSLTPSRLIFRFQQESLK